MQALGTLRLRKPQKVAVWDGFWTSPRTIRPLTSRFLGAKVKLQVEVFHHVTQFIIVRVLPKLRGREGRFRGGGTATAGLPSPAVCSAGCPGVEG